MKIHEILVENHDHTVSEGPLGTAVGAVGRGIGKAVGGVAKGIGAVAGGAVGALGALKKGYQAGKSAVGGDEEDDTTTATPLRPADRSSQSPQAQPAAPSQPTAAQAPQVTTTAAAPAGQTVYAQVKSQIDQLDKKGKQRILQLLQKSLPQPAAAPAAAAASPAAATAKPAARGKPIKVGGKTAAPSAPPTGAGVQTAGKIISRPALAESFSLYRKK